MTEILLYRQDSLEGVLPQILRPPHRKVLESAQLSWAHYKAQHTPDVLPDFHEWDWLKKKGSALSSSLVGLEHDGDLQGLLSVADNPVPIRCETDPGALALYVEYLEAAPWNHRLYAGNAVRFLGAGTALLSLAVQMSTARGYHGYVALHSIPSARNFYLRQGFREFPDDDTTGLSYFELSPSSQEVSNEPNETDS